MENYIITTKNLIKKYGTKTAVDNLDLNVEKGSIFGLLGPNGAGKSTIILMILGLTEPTDGFISVAGFNPIKEPLKIKRITGYLPEKVGFYEDMNAFQNLEYTGQLNDIPRKELALKIEESLKLVGLENDKNKIVKHYSKGMKQRLGIADVLIKDPELVIFDEPTEGLDVEVANQILETIKELNKNKGITFLISSHQLNLVQKICDRIGIMSSGRLIVEGNVKELGSGIFGDYKYQIEVELIGDINNAAGKVEKLKDVKSVKISENSLLIGTDFDIRKEISKTITSLDDTVLTKMDMKNFSLEDIYLNYFKEV